MVFGVRKMRTAAVALGFVAALQAATPSQAARRTVAPAAASETAEAPAKAKPSASRRTARTEARAEVRADVAARERANRNAVSIVSGNPNGTYLTAAYDLSAALDDGEALRVLPILGKGGAQNVRDVLYLHGVDMGITQTAIVNRLRRTKELGDIDSKLVYVTRLFNEELHILARPEIRSVHDLAGKTVNFSDAGSGTQLNAREVIEALGLDVKEVNLGQGDAIEKMRSGQIAATILVAGKPAGAFGKLKREDGFHFIPLAYGKAFEESYFPATLAHEDYPNLIAPGEHVETVAAAAVLIAFNSRKESERHRRLERFVGTFFAKFPELLKAPRHPKWQEVNLGAVLPGWRRFEPAQQWLDAHPADTTDPSAQESSALKAAFGQFVKNSGGAAGDNERLFEEFLRWRQQTGK